MAPTRFDQFEFLPGVAKALAGLKQQGFVLVVVTNQPDVATGVTPRAIVDAMHARIRSELVVDDIKVCFHTDADYCSCRKPKPGMILEAAAERAIDLERSYLVGDRWRDIEAGRAAGCLPIFVDYGFQQDGPNRPAHIVRSLPEAVACIIHREQSGTWP